MFLMVSDLLRARKGDGRGQPGAREESSARRSSADSRAEDSREACTHKATSCSTSNFSLSEDMRITGPSSSAIFSREPICVVQLVKCGDVLPRFDRAGRARDPDVRLCVRMDRGESRALK